MFHSLKSATVLLSALVTTTALADDWPQWRGPNRDGVWSERGVVDQFDSPQLETRWRVPLGPGYCSPTVADGRVFVMDRIAEPEPKERIHCFDAKSGAEIWSHTYDCVYRKVSYTAGPRASVTIEDGRAYALGTMGHLHCLDAGTGALLWSRDLREEYKIRMPVWGIAAAPLVFEDLVILHIGGEGDACLVALDKKGGDERWRALKDRASYSAPIIIEQAGQQVLVCWNGDSVAGLEPRTGKVHWRYPFPPNKMIIGIVTPVVDKNRLFVSNFYDGSLMLRLRQDRLAVEMVWKRCGRSERNTDSLHSIISTPLLDGDYVYGVDSYGELRCLEAETGDRVWEDQTATPPARWSTIHMVRNEDRIWMFNERGDLIIAQLSPQGYEELSRTHLLDPTTEQLERRGGVCWSHPAFADRHVYVRNDKELVCASLER